MLTDVVNAYEALRMNEEIIQLYQGGYVDQAKESKTSANIPINAAWPACWIIWIPNGPIGPINWLIARRWPVT